MNVTGTMNSGDENLIETIVDLMQRDESFDAPTDAIKWSKNLFRARAAVPETSFIKRVLAVMQIDLKPNEAIFGERSSSSAAPFRQLFFEAGESAIDLRVSENKGIFSLRGQILGENFANCAVRLGEYETVSNELSEFSLTEIPRGKYQLVLQTNNSEIVIENLEL